MKFANLHLHLTYSDGVLTTTELVIRAKLRLTAQEMIDIIRGAGGVASIAHPHKVTDRLEDLYKMGARAVEYAHPDIYGYDLKSALEFISRHDDVYACGGTDHIGLLANNANERGTPAGADFVTPLDADVLCYKRRNFRA